MILPAFKDAREFLGQSAMSYSEIATLSHCEKKWKLIYDNPDRPENEPSDAMELGSEMHTLLGHWWTRQDDSWQITDDETAFWLMDRYNTHYMNGDLLQMEAIEVPFAVHYLGRYFFGWVDGLVRDLKTGELWIAEFKTMSNWSKLDQLPVDKQVSLYIWALRRAGYDVKGVMYDAIRTYKWTGKNADSHEPAESFRREWVTRTDEQIKDFLDELGSAAGRKMDLFMNLDSPIRNVGQGCSWCSVLPQCYGIELTLTDEPASVTLNF